MSHDCHSDVSHPPDRSTTVRRRHAVTAAGAAAAPTFTDHRAHTHRSQFDICNLAPIAACKHPLFDRNGGDHAMATRSRHTRGRQLDHQRRPAPRIAGGHRAARRPGDGATARPAPAASQPRRPAHRAGREMPEGTWGSGNRTSSAQCHQQVATDRQHGREPSQHDTSPALLPGRMIRINATNDVPVERGGR